LLTTLNKERKYQLYVLIIIPTMHQQSLLVYASKSSASKDEKFCTKLSTENTKVHHHKLLQSYAICDRYGYELKCHIAWVIKPLTSQLKYIVQIKMLDLITYYQQEYITVHIPITTSSDHTN